MAGSAGAGYDISQSTSESSTQGFNKKIGDFFNGGGVRIPDYFWPAIIVGAVVVLVVWFKRK